MQVKKLKFWMKNSLIMKQLMATSKLSEIFYLLSFILFFN